MDKIAEKIVNLRIPILISTMVLLIVMIICAFNVKINYNMMDYLPEQANSTKAIKLMEDNFGEAMANCNVMVSDVSINEMDLSGRHDSSHRRCYVLWLYLLFRV